MGKERRKLTGIDKDSLSAQTLDSSEASQLGLSLGPHPVFGLPSIVLESGQFSGNLPTPDI